MATNKEMRQYRAMGRALHFSEPEYSMSPYRIKLYEGYDAIQEKKCLTVKEYFRLQKIRKKLGI